MTTKEFIVRETMSISTEQLNDVKKAMFDRVDTLLGSKGDEYSTRHNRFENFLDGAKSEGLPPERVLWFMMLKHWLSLKKMVRELSTLERRPIEVWDEKIGDMETYLILLKAMVQTREQIETTVDQQAAKGDTAEENQKKIRTELGAEKPQVPVLQRGGPNE